MDVANICCNGRVVSVLEGGYGGRHSHTRSVTPKIPSPSSKGVKGDSTPSPATLGKTKRSSRTRSKKNDGDIPSATDSEHEDVPPLKAEGEQSEPVELDRGILAVACMAHVKSLVRHPK
jgi:hypothetical protein